MSIIAIFSNGHKDEYKGDRAVKAAWMITDKETGEVLASGHSLDAQRAEKTARSNVGLVVRCDLPHFYVPQNFRLMSKEYAQQLLKQLKEHGAEPQGKKTIRTVYDAAKRANAQRSAAQRERAVIEVIEL